MNLEINQEEHGLLLGLLESRVEELHPEIRHTREREFKEHLKRELECLGALLQRIRTLAPAPT